MKLIFDRDKLLEKMAEQRMSALKLSEAAGLHRNTVQRIVSGQAVPHDVTIAQLAKALSCKPSELQTQTNE